MPLLMMDMAVLFLLINPSLLTRISNNFRSSIAHTKDFIHDDMMQAIAILQGKHIEQGRATPAAAAALKSRVLLFCGSKLTNGGYTAQAQYPCFFPGRTADSSSSGSQRCFKRCNGWNIWCIFTCRKYS